MPEIRTFAPWRYSTELVDDPGLVIAPPYDVIAPEKRQRLLLRDSRNVIRLILPEGDGDERYADAASLLSAWRNNGTLVHESTSGLFPYSQSFPHPGDGRPTVRRGFIALLRLVSFSEGSVLPHERTLSGPKADRLKLMQATDGNLEPIFGMYPDPQGESLKRLSNAMQNSPAMLDVTDIDGVRHTLWKCEAGKTVDELIQDIAAVRVFIVDGHHRYETALSYSKERPSGGDADWIMIFLAPSSDPGLIILPTHRVVRGIKNFDIKRLIDALSPAFIIEPQASRLEGTDALARTAPQPAFLLLTGNRTLLVTLDQRTNPASILPDTTPEALQCLDVTILHDAIFDRLLGISRADQESQRNLEYVKSAEEAFAAADREDVDMVVMMNPTRLEQVEQVAASGDVMPQKSTFFAPKIASGLLFNMFE